MLKVILCSLLLWSSLSSGEELKRFISSKCDHLGVNALTEMGLEPQFENNELCPTSWKWPEYKDDACYYKGNYYNHGEDFIHKNENTETFCKCNVRKGNKKFMCDNANWTSTWKPADMNYTCESGNYYGNQIFWPEDSCVKCTCQPDFNGEYVPPLCHRIGNDISMEYQKEIYNQCTPYYLIYNNNPALCIPSGFICNEDLYEISPTNVVKATNDSNNVTCKIDDELYPKGTMLNVTFLSYNSKINVNCSCLNPPLLTCINIYDNWSPPIPVIEPLETKLYVKDPVIAEVPVAPIPEVTTKIIEDEQA